MSTTVSMGVYGASYWIYMASDLIYGLFDAVERGRLEEGDIPRGIYLAAKKFLKLALEANGGGIPENPPASINAYLLAKEAATTGKFSSPLSPEDLQDLLVRLSEFLETLEGPRGFEPVDKEKAEEFSKFLRGLVREGYEERYEELAGYDRSYAVARFW